MDTPFLGAIEKEYGEDSANSDWEFGNNNKKAPNKTGRKGK